MTEEEPSSGSSRRTHASPAARVNGDVGIVRRILLPLDGSPAAETVLASVIPLALAFDAHVDLIHVIPDRKSLARMGPEDPLDWRMSCRRATEYLAGIQRRLADAGVTANAQVEEGGPAAILVTRLRGGRYDLVALAPHGMSGHEDLAMGATSGAVILHAPASLLLVPTGFPGRPLSKILVPIDGSPRSECAVSLALNLARRVGAETHLLHVLVPPRRFGRLSQDPVSAEASHRLAEANRRAALRYMAEAAAWNAPGEPEIRGKVLDATRDVVATILDEVGTLGADLVVLGAHGREGPVGTSVGSIPLRFLLSSHVPTLVMQDPRGSAGPSHAANPAGRPWIDAPDSYR